MISSISGRRRTLLVAVSLPSVGLWSSAMLLTTGLCDDRGEESGPFERFVEIP